MRSLAREVVFKYLYSQLFNQDDKELFNLLKTEEKLNDSDCEFADNLLNNAIINKDKYLSVIENLSTGFKINRIFNADKCALIIGMTELDFFKETPVPVIINEAVNLSAKFSTEKSTDFVNGILAEYVRSI